MKNRDALGRRVREVWVEWAKRQPDPKPSWLVPWDELAERDKEVDRQIGETIAQEATFDVERKWLDDRRVQHGALDAANTRAHRYAFLFVATALALIVSAVVAALWTSARPAASASAPAPALAPATVPVDSVVSSPESHAPRGYYDAHDVLHDWPTPTSYEPDQFTEDCYAVCQAPGFDRQPGRVLMLDPALLLCVCFHRDSSFPVDRWVRWERVHE